MRKFAQAKMRGLLNRVAWLLLLILNAPVVFGQTTVSNQSLGYLVTMPAGWEQIPTSVIDAQLQTVASAVGGHLSQHFDDGFQKSVNTNQLLVTGSKFQYPYILVESKHNGRIPEGKI